MTPGVMSCSRPMSYCDVLSGTIGAKPTKVRSGGTQSPAVSGSRNSSAPGASNRRDTPARTRNLSRGTSVTATFGAEQPLAGEVVVARIPPAVVDHKAWRDHEATDAVE